MAEKRICCGHQCLLYGAMVANGGHERKRICETHCLVTGSSFGPREQLYQQGQPVQYLFMVRSGYVKLSASFSDGRTQNLMFGTRLSVMGLEALHDATYPFTATASTKVEACKVRRDDWLRALDENPETCLRLIKMLNGQLRSALFQIRDLGLMDAKERVASFLLSVAFSHPDSGPDYLLPLSRRNMAQLLGLAEETVIRSLARLREEGVIDLPSMSRSFRILDRHRLSALVGDHVFNP